MTDAEPQPGDDFDDEGDATPNVDASSVPGRPTGKTERLVTSAAVQRLNSGLTDRLGPTISEALGGYDFDLGSRLGAMYEPSLTARVGAQLSAANFGMGFRDLEKLTPSSSIAQAITAGTQFGPAFSALAEASRAAVSLVSPSQSLTAMAAELGRPIGVLAQASLAAQSLGSSSGSFLAEAVAQLSSLGIQSLLATRMPIYAATEFTGVLARAAALESEFASPRPGVAAGFGLLQERIEKSTRLSAEVAGFAEVAAAPPKGALKLPAKELHQRAERIENALTDDPDLRDDLAGPLAEVRAVSATDDWDTMNLAALLNVLHRPGVVTGIAVACGVTVSITGFLIGAGTGQPIEQAVWQNLGTGAATYVYLNGRRRDRRGTERPEKDEA